MVLLRVAPAAWSALVLLHGSPAPPRAPVVALKAGGFPAEALAARVRDALIEEEERPYQVWKEEERPLKINLDLLTYRARKLAQRGDRRGAVATYKRCIQLDPLDGRSWLGLSQLRVKQNRLTDAEELLLQGIKSCPSNAYLLQGYGRLQEKQGKQDEALALYQRAVRAQPQHEAAWVALGLLLGKRKKAAAAGQCLRLACVVAPKSYYAWQVVGLWYKQQGELSAAREAFRTSLQLNSRNAATFHAWGVLEWRCGHVEIARELFRKGLQAQPRNSYLLQSWACMEARGGNSARATQLFEAAERQGCADGASWQARAMQQAAEGAVDEARRCFAKGIAAEPTHVPLFHAWATMEADLSNVTAAREPEPCPT